MPKHDPNDMTSAAVEARRATYDAGYEHGEEMAEEFVRQARAILDDDYLIYLFLLGVKQAIENRAREIGGINFSRTQDDPQNMRRAPKDA